MEKSYTYILLCGDNSLYTGWTLDVERRLKEHSDGKGAKYCLKRLPLKVVYIEEFDTRAKAAQREWQIKKLNRVGKIKLIQSKHPEFTI